MRRFAPLIVLALLVLPATAGAASPSVKLVDCEPALDPLERTATFEARAKAAEDSERMQVRFTLQVHEDGLPGWRRVVADGFDTWLTSDEGVRRYTYAKTVQNLTSPASYRVQVRFRWLDEDGDVAARSRRTSPACKQPDMRPNLVPQAIDTALAPDPAGDLRRYAVTVRNLGRSAADPFAVALRVGDAELDPQVVFGLEPGQEQVVTFLGPACSAGDPLVATVDGGETVDERIEDDNALSVDCGALQARRR
jgi:hypothetical protein